MVRSAVKKVTWVGKARTLMVFGSLLAAMTAAIVVAVLVASNPAQAVATTFTVNSTGDDGDETPDGTCDTCTLREAIQEANANVGADTIKFAIPGDGPHTIAPASQLRITEPVTIDGYTGSLDESTPASPNTDAGSTTNAVLRIVLNGANAIPCLRARA